MIARRTLQWIAAGSLSLTLAWSLAAAQAPFFSTFLPFVSSAPHPTALTPARLLISEVMYDPRGVEPGGEWIELFNPGSFDFPLTGVKLGDAELRGKIEGMFRFPDGSRLPAGETLVVASNAHLFEALHERLPDYELNDSDPRVPDLDKYEIWASDRVELVNSGDEVLLLSGQDQVLDAVSWGSSPRAFDPPVKKVAEGRSIERFPAHRDTDQAEDWRDRAFPDPWGVELTVPEPTSTPAPASTLTASPPAPSGQPSPTAAPPRTPEPTPPAGRVLISEVMVSCSQFEPDCEWIELYNAGGSSVDLSTVCLGDQAAPGDLPNDGMRCFPTGTQLASGQVIVIAGKGTIFIDQLGVQPDFEMVESSLDIPNLVINPEFGSGRVMLENTGDEVVLIDTRSGVLDIVSWGSSTAAFSPALPTSQANQSIERYPPVEDHDSAQDWRQAPAPSPGKVQYP